MGGRLEHLRLGVIEFTLDSRPLASQLAHLTTAVAAGTLDLAVQICELQLHPLDLDQDPELKALMAELVVEAGAERAKPALLEVQRMQLELAYLDRQIQRARGQGGGEVSELARERARVKSEFDHAQAEVLGATAQEGG